MKLFALCTLPLLALTTAAHAEGVCAQAVSQLASDELSSKNLSVEAVQSFTTEAGVSVELYEAKDLNRLDPAIHHGRYEPAPFRYFVSAVYTKGSQGMSVESTCELHSFHTSN